MSIIHNIFFFIVAIGVLVTFHEFGHYWVARKSNVKVIRFSVGFGSPLFKWTRKKGEDVIEYVVAAIPLGGYVKMLDGREDAHIPSNEKHRAFDQQPLLTRTLIVAAGPVFNLVLAILLYALVFMIGTTEEKPILGKPGEDTIAANAGFKENDEVLQVGNTKIRSWGDFHFAVIDEGIDGGILPVLVADEDGIQYTRQLDIGEKKLLEKESNILADMGFGRWRPELPAVIGGVVKESVAEKSGLKEGDRVVSIDNIELATWDDMVDYIRENPDEQVVFNVLRDGGILEINLIPEAVKTTEGDVGRIGAYQKIPDEVRERLLVNVQYGFFDSLAKGIERTWDMSVLIIKVFGKMITGEAALSNISGPFTIAKYAGVTAAIGLTTYLGFLAVISVSLGVLNLMPVPMLDGGHLMYYLVEAIKGSPVSEAVEIRGQQIGLVLLAILMCIALFNDYHRLIQ